MLYLLMQLASLLTVTLLLGLIFGWLAHRLSNVWGQHSAQLAELADLRRHYSDLALQNVALRNQLKQTQAALRKVRVIPSETDYGEFLQVRKALEYSRQQYQVLLEQYHTQQQQLEQLQLALQRSQQEHQNLRTQASNGVIAAPMTPSTTLPVTAALQYDDLTCLQGVTAALAKQLTAFGISSYRQLAEFSLADIQFLHTLFGADLEGQPEQWIQEARQRLQSACNANFTA